MLKVDDLKAQIKKSISEIVVPAIEKITLKSYSLGGKEAEKFAKETAETFDELVAEQFADVIANAIDYYVKNIAITGTIITVGSAVTQTANIFSMPTPSVNGKIPNTLGIS